MSTAISQVKQEPQLLASPLQNLRRATDWLEANAPDIDPYSVSSSRGGPKISLCASTMRKLFVGRKAKAVRASDSRIVNLSIVVDGIEFIAMEVADRSHEEYEVEL